VAKGVDVRVNTMQAATLDPASDRAPSEAGGLELGAADDTVLTSRQAGNRFHGRFRPISGHDLPPFGHAAMLDAEMSRNG
jgi:hypothetical protein